MRFIGPIPPHLPDGAGRAAVLAVMLGAALGSPGAGASPSDAVAQKAAAEGPSLVAYYEDLHAHPELSLMEEKTSAKLAGELRAAGYSVTEKFGGYGVVAVLRNGAGPTVLVRTDMDALPVVEETGLPYASQVRTLNLSGKKVGVMHACGHDIHMAVMVGTARTLSALRDRWSGTVVLIGQPAEELGVGARTMLGAGLYRRFPKPDYAVALHDSASLAAGTFGIGDGFILANVDTMEIKVHGRGGHGAYPQLTIDPIVLSARLILDFQTIVSRETDPTDPAVVTVGSIDGGTKANVIPDEVDLQLSLRSYSEAVRRHTIEAIRRMCRGEAIAAGLPESLFPEVIEDHSTPATYNDPALTRRVRASLTREFGPERVKQIPPEMVSEDFSQYSRTTERVPTCLFRLGAVAPEKIAESERTGIPLPSLHSSRFAPEPQPTIGAGVTAMATVVMDLLPKR